MRGPWVFPSPLCSSVFYKLLMALYMQTQILVYACLVSPFFRRCSSFFYKFLVAVIPPLGLRICYWIAPDLLVLLSHMQGCNSQSSAQQLAAQRFYILLLCNVFFAYLITDTIVNTIVVCHQTTRPHL